MTFAYTDPDGHHLDIEADTGLDGQPVITAWTRGAFARVPVRIPLDRIEELVAGIRDTARQAAASARPTRVPCTTTVLRQQPHPPHDWEPQPGMTPVHCPGGTP
ncbi:hypothetical protein [Streptomyces sp. NPDC058812]|uniref:hypothetical protein n=1 Tax=unclassified Streptomyces TaxID=2593676 RepID=UPI0036918420